MKNILVILTLFLFFTACEEDSYVKPDINQVSVYQIQGTNTAGNSIKLNVYKTDGLISTTNGNSVHIAETAEYQDLSTDVVYDISFSAMEVREETVVIMAPLYDDDGNVILNDDESPYLVETPITVESKYNYSYEIVGTVEDSNVIATYDLTVESEYLGDNTDYEYYESKTVSDQVSGKMETTKIYL